MALPRDILGHRYDRHGNGGRGGRTRARDPGQIPRCTTNLRTDAQQQPLESRVLLLGLKSSITMRPGERSSNFIAPSTSNGCAMACAYCYGQFPAATAGG